jgi:hypothetical protein
MQHLVYQNMAGIILPDTDRVTTFYDPVFVRSILALLGEN